MTLLRVEKRAAPNGVIETWTLNQPELGNAITSTEFVVEFERAIDAANADFSVKAIVLTGEGKIFSAGGDVKAMADRRGMFGVDERQQRWEYVNGIQRLPRALQRLEVPIIAAVNGPAIGAGCDFATMCDLRVASERASFAESFVQLGIIPGDGGAWFLQRTIGYERAAEMTLTGDRIDAATALDWGLVSRVVPHEELLPAAYELAERIAKNPAHALRMAKRLMLEARAASLESVLTMSAAMQPLAHLDPEHEQRIARWKTE